MHTKFSKYFAWLLLISMVLAVVQPAALAAPGTPTDPDTPYTQFLPTMMQDTGLRNYTISGRVVDGDDNPVAGVSIVAKFYSTGNTAGTAVSDAQGNFTVTNLPAESYAVTAEKSSLFCMPDERLVSVAPSATLTDFTCSTSLHSFSGQITDSNGDPVAGITVTNNAGASAVTGIDGTYTLNDLPAGIHTFMPTGQDASGSDYLFNPRSFTVRLGTTSRMFASESTSQNFVALANPWNQQFLGQVGGMAGPIDPTNRRFDRAIQVDSKGNIHVAFMGNDLYHGMYDGTVWTFTLLDTGVGPATCAPARNDTAALSMALDGGDNIHIAYYDACNRDLGYVRQYSAIWELGLHPPIQIDYPTDVGSLPSLAIAPNGTPHVAYFSEEDDRLKHAYLDGSNWRINSIDVQNNVGYYPSIAITSDNLPRVAYFDYTNANDVTIKYASASLKNPPVVNDYNFTWAISDVTQQSVLKPETAAALARSRDPLAVLLTSGLFLSLDLTSTNAPMIAYFRESNDDLRLARWTGASWNFTTVDRLNSVGAFATLVINTENRPNIVYWDQISGDLRFARELSTGWKLTTIDGGMGNDVGRFANLALDRSGLPHFFYYDATAGDMKYATINRWKFDDISMALTVPAHANRALAVDRDGVPHVAFGSGGQLLHGFWNGSAFQYETVNAVAGTYSFAAIATDAFNGLHISYYYQTAPDNGQLWYAYKAEDALVWSNSPVDLGNDEAGKFNSIAIDNNNRPHIAYFDEDDDNLLYAYYNGTSWMLEGVDLNPSVTLGPYASLALMSNGTPAIAYYNQTTQDLLYAVRVGANNWSRETVASTSKVGLYNSLAFDSFNRPHIAYFEDGGDLDSLNYTYKSGGVWNFTQPDNAGNVGGYLSLDIDSGNVAHISYWDQSLGNLKYAYGSGSNWKVEVVDSTDVTGLFTSLILDSGEHPRILYYNQTSAMLRYAELNRWEISTLALPGVLEEPGRPWLAIDAAGYPHVSYGVGSLWTAKATVDGWLQTQVDATAGVGSFSSIALTTDGFPRIVYYDTVGQELQYSEGFTVIDTSSDVGKYASLVMDSTGKLHAAYFDEDNDDLRYARFDGTSWTSELVDSGGAVGSYPWIAVNSVDGVRIAYYDISNASLKFAIRNGTNNWSVITLQSAGDIGLYASLDYSTQQGGDGLPRIAFFDDDNDDLVYTYLDDVSGAWVRDVVDRRGSAGFYSSLAMDGNNVPHIAYYEFTNQNLKYTVYRNNVWLNEVVDIAGDVGMYASLALDGAGQPVIAYYDATGNTIRLARAIDW